MLNTQSQQQIFVKQLRQLLSGRRNTTRRSVTNSIVSCLGYYGEAFPTQTYLGSKADVVRETACRSLKTLQGSILVIRNRGYKKTCQYWLTSEFLNNRHHFYDLIPALRQVNLLLLFSITSNVYSQNVTQYKELNKPNKRTASSWQFAVVKNAGYGFYEQHPSETIVFFKKQQSTTSIGYQPLEGEAIMNNSVITFLAETYGLSVDQEQRLNNCSTESLEYAVKELNRQQQTTTINNPVNWISKVAAAYKPGSTSFPKMGRMGDYAKKIVNVSTNNNHSPSKHRPNISVDERIDLLEKEITKYKDMIANPENYFKKPVDISSAVEGTRSRLMATEDELSQIKMPGAKVHAQPSLSNDFKTDYEIASRYTEGPSYEADLDELAKRMSNPEEFKKFRRRTDYRRTARK
jgi:hypothetical protein